MPELVPGTYYQFKVSALNSLGESDLSSAVSILAATFPDPPSIPTKVQADKTYISIAWTVTYDGGSSVDDYQVDWKLDSDVSWIYTITSTNNLKTLTASGL
jgi:hypothetical protein